MNRTCQVATCGRPSSDRLCERCTTELADALTAVARAKHPTRRQLPSGVVEIYHGGLWEDLDVTLTKQHRLPKAPRSGTASGSPVGFHVGASDARRDLESTVWYWVYLFADANQHLSFDPYTATVPEACLWVAQFPGLIAAMDDASTMHADILRTVTAAHQAVDTLPLRAFVGLCGKPVELVEDGIPKIGPCPTPLFRLDGFDHVVCRHCAAFHDATARSNELVHYLMDKTGTPTDISRALAMFGFTVSPNTIRTWARARVEPRRLQPAGWTKTKPPHPLYRYADVVKRAGLLPDESEKAA